MTKVAMIGVGKLGQDCAEIMAEQYDVVGYDVEPRTPAFPMKESIREAVEDRDIIFIAAPTPHDPMYGGEAPTSHLPVKDFDYTIVSEILDEVNKYVTQNQLVVLISTVLPGTVRNILRPKITNARFIYNPYLIAMGTVKWDMVNPEMLIIGTEDGSITGDAAELIEFYRPMMQNSPRIEVGTWDEAESIKIFYNTFISTKLALVNMIQDVAEKNGNINVDVVTEALANSTYRIMGPAYMKAGLGDAGACHPRDNIALRHMADKLDLGYDLFDSIMRAREVQAENMALRCLRNGNNVTIIGKAYKPGVPYCNGSASMLVGHYIEKHGGNVHYYDENTGDFDLRSDWTHVYLIGYWESYVESITPFPLHTTVIDPWRKYDATSPVIHYGNTRKELAINEHVEYQESSWNMIKRIWPELADLNDQCFMIYANQNSEYNITNFPTEAIMNTVDEQYKNGRRYFIFEGLSDPIQPPIVNKMHIVVQQINKHYPDAKCFFLTGCLDGVEVYNKILAEYNWEPQLEVFAGRFFEVGSHRGAKDFTPNIYDATRLRKKNFIALNRMPRPHRLALVEKLFEYDLIDKGYVSFGTEPSWDTRTKFIIEHCKDEFPNIYKNIDKLPLDINIATTRENPADIWIQDVEFFEESYFSVVTETVYFTGPQTSMLGDSSSTSIFPSEKIYKPIAMLQPFILASTPGFLSALRKCGYKTFHPYINETYDTIEDDNERMTAIVNEIARLCSFTDDEWKEWMQNIKPIVEYNKNYWFNNDDYRVTTDVLKYFG
jgi:UDPglucose 6-dehydrogenase